MSRKATRPVRRAHVRIDVAAPNVAPPVAHRRWRMFALIVGTLLSLLIPLLAFYFNVERAREIVGDQIAEARRSLLEERSE